MKQAAHFTNSASVVLENIAKLKLVLKWTSFPWWERTLSTSYGCALCWHSNKPKKELIKEILLVRSTGYVHLDDSEQGSVLDCEETGEVESEMSVGDGNTVIVDCQDMSI